MMGCAAPKYYQTKLPTPPSGATTAPAADDWNTEFSGVGAVHVQVTNASGSALFLKVKRGEATVAQVKLDENGSRSLSLHPGQYATVMRISSGDRASHYRGPEFDIPPNTASASMILQGAATSNLEPISAAEFE